MFVNFIKVLKSPAVQSVITDSGYTTKEEDHWRFTASGLNPFGPF